MSEVISHIAYLERDYFAKGFAACESRILTDTIYCRYRDEHFEFPSSKVFNLIEQNEAGVWLYPGSFAAIKVKSLRKIADRKA